MGGAAWVQSAPREREERVGGWKTESGPPKTDLTAQLRSIIKHEVISRAL